MSRQKVLVLGGNFGGLTAALAVKHELHGDVDVIPGPQSHAMTLAFEKYFLWKAKHGCVGPSVSDAVREWCSP
jgi:hypothetical protein